MHPVGPPLGAYNKSATFGTDGIRGKVGTALTPELLLQLGYWASHVLPRIGPILIGKDSRQSGDMVTAALTAGLTAAGREVWLIGLCPTPAIPHLIKKTGTSGGLMVSASHNPPEDNGIKIFDENGIKIDSVKQLFIESHIKGDLIDNHASPTCKSFGKIFNRNELIKTYQEDLVKTVKGDNFNGMPIVLDLCWGSATACGEEVFNALGANLTIINGNPDGKKINVGCGSTNLGPLREAVIQTKANMGFAFDGDADRVLAIDHKGRVIDGDHVLYIWGSTLQDRGELPYNKLITTVMSNLGFEKAWEARGGILERTPVGDQNVHAAMVETGAALGGEQSGHILSAKHGLCGDGLLTALQITKICQERSFTLAQFRDQSFKAFPQKLVNLSLLNLADQKSWRDCEPIQKAVFEAEESMGDEGRVLLRESGTEPLLRVMVEAKDQVDVDSWISHLAKVVKEYLEMA